MPRSEILSKSLFLLCTIVVNNPTFSATVNTQKIAIPNNWLLQKEPTLTSNNYIPNKRNHGKSEIFENAVEIQGLEILIPFDKKVYLASAQVLLSESTP